LPVIKAKITNVEKAAEFFLRKIHGLELYGDIQEAVLDFRRARNTFPPEALEDREALYETYHAMFIELYREELEHWINENEVIHMNLKSR
jgi:hypothetical protein